MAAALAAVPLADAGIKYAAEVSRSIVAQVSDALRAPLVGTETTILRNTPRGTKTTTTRASLPAWVAVSGLLVAAWWFSSSRPGEGGGGGGWKPFTGILSDGAFLPIPRPPIVGPIHRLPWV